MKKINVITLGCSKNLVDSEVLMNQLEKQGYEVVFDSNDEDIDIVIINTCGFILDAKEESVETILDYVEAKKEGTLDKIYVMGCLSARYKDELIAEIPEVDRFFGKFDLGELVKELGKTVEPDWLYQRKITTPSHYAYLKIAEGCNRTCSFCAIPNFTGKYQSKPIEELVKEAEFLAQNGVKELLLIAQDLSYYGQDLYKENKLAELVRRLSEIEGIEWIKLHYTYPSKFPMDVLNVMRENPKVCKYLDIPLQHCTDNMLKMMRRNINSQETIELVDQIRKEVPGIALRTTLLVGHPGETDEDYQALVEFVKEARFERLGVFAYSHEDDTFAARNYSDDIPKEVKDERAELIMEIQQKISTEINTTKVGQVLKVIVDLEEDEFYIGRTEFDSPEVDGEVLIKKTKKLQIGHFYSVKITDSNEFDLFGKVV